MIADRSRKTANDEARPQFRREERRLRRHQEPLAGGTFDLGDADRTNEHPGNRVAAVDRCHDVLDPDELTTLIVAGVGNHGDELDEVIAARAKGWTLERMPVIDLSVLRIGALELAHRPDVPVAVVLDEAVELAKRFSTDDSGRFVNGVLSALVADLRPT